MTSFLIPRKNLERYCADGKSEADYYDWATRVGQRMHINTIDAAVCAKIGVYTVAHLASLPTALPMGIAESEVNDYLLANSENAYELAKLWRMAMTDAAAWQDVESVIADGLAVFPKDNFVRWGDRNALGDIGRGWFSATGLPIDVQVVEMQERCSQITIEAVIAFVTKYKPRSYKNPAARLAKTIEARFMEVVGFRLKDYYVEHLIRSCEVNTVNLNIDVPF